MPDPKPDYRALVAAAKADLVAAGVHVDLDEASRAQITFRAAARAHALDPSVGLLYKPQGNQIRERAVDIFCFPDGVIVDVLGSGPEGPNTPLWMENAVPVDPSRWRAPFTDLEPLPAPAAPAAPAAPPAPPAPEPPAPPVPVPPVPVPAPAPPAPPPVVVPAVTKAVALGFFSALFDLLAGWWSRRGKGGTGGAGGGT